MSFECSPTKYVVREESGMILFNFKLQCVVWIWVSLWLVVTPFGLQTTLSFYFSWFCVIWHDQKFNLGACLNFMLKVNHMTFYLDGAREHTQDFHIFCNVLYQKIYPNIFVGRFWWHVRDYFFRVQIWRWMINNKTLSDQKLKINSPNNLLSNAS